MRIAQTARRIAIVVLGATGLVVAASAQSRPHVDESQGRRPTPIFTCGQDESLQEPLRLAAADVILAGDARRFAPCAMESAGPHPEAHREMREADVLARALASKDPELRRLAVQALGRLGDPSPGALADPVVAVRREAAYAMAASAAPASVTAAWEALTTRVDTEVDDAVAQTMLETIGRLRYADNAARDRAEALLVAHAQGAVPRIVGAVKGLESLTRQDPRRPIAVATRDRLRALAVTVAPARRGATDVEISARIRRLALLALQTARDEDVSTWTKAAADSDWQVRRMIAARLDVTRADLAPLVAKLIDDPALQVRYEVVGAEGREAMRSKACAPLIRRFADPSLVVALRAMDVVPTGCEDLGEVLAALIPRTDWIRRADATGTWHAAARALVTIARIKPDAVAPLVGYAVDHVAWQVRAAAATSAGLIGDEATLVKLTDDPEPNVRTTAIEALARRNVPAAAAAAVRALDSSDFQLIRAAALTLRGAPSPVRDRAVTALLDALKRLTAQGFDTSRDPRVAIIARLEELLPADRARELESYLGDVDRSVREAATRAYVAITKAPAPPVAQTRERYPLQPTRDELASLPTRATIRMDGLGTMEIELFPSQAPVTIARIARLARAGYYNGLTLHRMAPNFVLQGGSPGANEYTGAERYMRDEVGIESHVRGAIGISTRGRDTGDGQFFLDLIDVPRLDHDYTVLGRVVSGLEVMDRVLEGAKIVSVTVR